MSGVSSVYEAVVIPDLSDTGRKLKNNVILFSSISLFMFFGDVSISEKSSFLGFLFNGLNQDKIYVGLMIVIVYSYIHYAFLLKDSLSEWRLRCSVISNSNDSNPEGDLSLAFALQNVKYNNLYYWWQHQKDYYIELESKTPELLDVISALKVRLECDSNVTHGDSVSFNSLSHDIHALREYVGTVSYLFKSNNIEASLKNFNEYYRSFLKFQNIRWLIFEFIVPLALAILSLYFLSSKVSLYILNFFNA